MPVNRHGQTYARKILCSFPENSIERRIADANIACRRKGSQVRCGLPFCAICGNAAIVARQQHVLSRLAAHPDSAVFAVTILDDVVDDLISPDGCVSGTLIRRDLMIDKVRRLLQEAGLVGYWVYGSVEYEVRRPSQFTRFVRDCLRNRDTGPVPEYVVVPHVHLLTAAAWPDGRYLTGQEIARLLTGGGEVESRDSACFCRPQQVMVQPIRHSIAEDAPRLVDYGLKFRLRGNRGPDQTDHPAEIVRALARVCDAGGPSFFQFDIEHGAVETVPTLAPSARKSPLLVTLHRERVAASLAREQWDPEAGEIAEPVGEVGELPELAARRYQPPTATPPLAKSGPSTNGPVALKSPISLKISGSLILNYLPPDTATKQFYVSARGPPL